MYAVVVPAILFMIKDGRAVLYEREEGAGAIIFDALYEGAVPIMELDQSSKE